MPRFGETEADGEDASTTPAGTHSDVIVAGSDIRDGTDDTASSNGHRHHGESSGGGGGVTWPLDPLPFTGTPVEKRPMKLY